jgi:alkaline phosphatase D
MKTLSQFQLKLFLVSISLFTLLFPGCKQKSPGFGDGLAKKPLQRIAFGSCAKQWMPQPIWNTIAETKPDLFLFIGDAIYGDWDGENVFEVTDETLRRDWGKLAATPEFKQFRKKVPFMATWDNHDYGKHDGGADFPKKELTKKYFLDFFNEPEESERRQSPGIYDARIFGPQGKRVQIILLDTRWFKSPFKKDPRSKEELKKIGKVGKYIPNTNPDVTLLGGIQWQWLDEQLKKPAEIRFIVSSTQIVANEKGMDEWGNFPADRQRLFDLIGSTNANGVILLSGNVHFAELSKTNEGPYPLYDFTSSGLTHVNEVYGKAPNSFRVAGPYIDLNFGLVEIDWQAQRAPQISLKVLGLDRAVAFEYHIDASVLKN